MDNEYQKAKITFELEGGSKVEFVAYLRIQEQRPTDPFLPDSFLSDGKWHGKKLPEPPKWCFTGTTLGEITVTIPWLVS